jgi:DNA ligase-1
MKAPSTGASLDELKAMNYPVACSPKLDGIRGVITDKGVMSNSLKPLGNAFMQEKLKDPALLGLDGELVVGLPYNDLTLPDDDVFNRTSGNIRRSSGEPDFKFYVFDDFTSTDQTYQDRWIQNIPSLVFTNPYVEVLEQFIADDVDEALSYEQQCLDQGYEGMMVRDLNGVYKEGRCTVKEQIIIKRKPLAQSEGTIVGVVEQMKNNNEKAVNELGNSFRTSHKDNKEGKGTLGAVTLLDPLWGGKTFNCGTIIGGTAEWRQKMWDNPELLIGNIMTYVYQEVGSIDKPRQPRGKAEFRMLEDMSNY